MFITLIWVVLISAVIILFSGYWLKFLKTFKLPMGLILGVPLCVLSFLLLKQEAWVLYGLRLMQWGVHFSLNWIRVRVPFFAAHNTLFYTAMLTVVTMIPMCIAKLFAKPFRPVLSPFWPSVFVWTTLILLVLIPL